VDLDQRALQLLHLVLHRVLVGRVLHAARDSSAAKRATRTRTHTHGLRARMGEPAVDVVREPVAKVRKRRVDVGEQDQANARLSVCPAA
jgi:hypothetical protein